MKHTSPGGTFKTVRALPGNTVPVTKADMPATAVGVNSTCGITVFPVKENPFTSRLSVGAVVGSAKVGNERLTRNALRKGATSS